MDDTIFSYIDSVLFNKRKLNTINEGETQFNIYMVDRWCSMYSPDITQIINETSNIYGKMFSTKQEQYEFLLNILPKTKKTKINYLKKIKEEKTEENSDIQYIAKSLELSKREINEYITILNPIVD